MQSVHEDKKMIQKLKNNRLEVELSRHGAELRSIKYGGREYLWQGDAKYWEDRAIVLFPVVGRCLDDKIEAGGKSYPMEAHGFAWLSDFEVIESGEEFCTLCLASNDKTKAIYPYDFKFYVSFKLEENKIIQQFRVENTGSESMYCTLGGHPGFRCGENGDFEKWELVLAEDNELVTTLVTDDCYISAEKRKVDSKNGQISLKRELFLGDALIFEETKSNKITLRHKEKGMGASLDYSDFPVIAAWTLPEEGADFLCLEPWCGMGHREGEGAELSERFGMMCIPAGDEWVKSFTIEIF